VGRDEIEFSLTYLPSEPPSAPASLPLSRSSQKGHEPLGLWGSVATILRGGGEGGGGVRGR